MAYKTIISHVSKGFAGGNVKKIKEYRFWLEGNSVEQFHTYVFSNRS